MKRMFAILVSAGSLMVVAADQTTCTASVAPKADAAIMKYSPMIFGHFIEHFDNQVYGGLYWPGSPFSDEDGFRKDVIEALKEIKCPIVRWPGGCYVSDYHWKCGVGPNRQPMWNKAWNVEDPNTFGTDEYVKWCRKVGCEPYICTNAGTGDEEEMSDWVEYCNLSVGKWGRERIKNGYEKPHNVKYWSVGNENWGRHEIGAKTVEQWGPFVRESAKMMRGTDHSIYLFAAALPNEGWTLPLLKTAGYLLDYVSVHGYYVSRMAPYIKCMARSSRPEANITRTIKVLEKAGFGGGKVGIAFDEWNLRSWYHPGLGQFRRDDKVNYEARRENDIASTYTMADALFAATFLNTCLRHCNIVKMANFSPIVNTRGAIFVHKDGILKRTTYYVFKMYTNLLEANVMPVDVKCGVISHEKDSAPLVDAVLTVSDDGKRRVLAVVNKSPDSVVQFDMSSLTSAATLNATVLDGDSPDAFNDIGAENRVVPRKTEFKVNGGKVSLAPHSLSIIELK
jgi:alpha-N-arabinofuranosidase